MQTAQAMAGIPGDRAEKENLATKALGVLHENGPYGMVLYLECQKGTVAPKYTEHLVNLCGKETLPKSIPEVPAAHDFQSVTGWLQHAAADLDTYLFIKRLWQQALTYTRYHCKATGGESPSSE
jgi:hypothetical protein